MGPVVLKMGHLVLKVGQAVLKMGQIIPKVGLTNKGWIQIFKRGVMIS